MNTFHRTRNRACHGWNGGFTLLELMVAISILVMLCGLVMQLMGSATRLTSTSKQSSDCDSEARFALSQIASDLGRRIRRPDVDAFLDKATGNDRLFLFSETAGWSTGDSNPSTVSLVGYRIYNPAGSSTSQLQRFARALPWTSAGTGGPGIPFVALDDTRLPVPSTTLSGVNQKGVGGSFPGVITGNDSENNFYQLLAENVVRFEVSLLRKPDPLNPTLAAQGLVPDDQVVGELASYGFTRLSGVVISMVIMDSQNMARISPQDLSSLENFGDTNPSMYPLLPMDEWLKTFSKTSSGWPKPLRSGMRFYQRTISL
jgi:prepilin-type N-terminal cleavage/methylation domain-containing protein